jgi:hypothetical protein
MDRPTDDTADHVSSTGVTVHRAPMRSRSDAVDRDGAVEWAVAHGVVGVGDLLDPGSDGPAAARRLADRQHRFAEVEPGAFVWTWSAVGGFRLGRVTGPARRDASAAAREHDLVVIRPCAWIDEEIEPGAVPDDVLVAFDRGGRNFQRIRAAGVGAPTERLWRERQADEDPSA